MIYSFLTSRLKYFSRIQLLRCKIVDKHMDILSKKHLETRFIRLNAEKAPFLTERLKIRVMPTILMVKDTNVIDRFVLESVLASF